MKRIILASIIIILGSTNYHASHESMAENNCIEFQPADQFMGPGMIGNYNILIHTATINDPLETTDTCIFKFNHVNNEYVEYPENSIFIGSYTTKENGLTINLYGIWE